MTRPTIAAPLFSALALSGAAPFVVCGARDPAGATMGVAWRHDRPRLVSGVYLRFGRAF